MKKFVEKIKAWFKEIDWEKVGYTLLGLLGVGIVAALAKEASDAISNSILNSTDYGMKIYNEAVRASNEDGLVEKFNSIWNESHPDFDTNDESQLQEQADAFGRMFKPYLDKVAKEHTIGGKMLDFDETEPLTLKPVDESRGLYEPFINAKIKKIN